MRMQPATSQRDTIKVLHYLPGELLVVLGRDQRQLANGNIVDTHRQLLQSLNGLLERQQVALTSGRVAREGRAVPALSFASEDGATNEVHFFGFGDGGFPDEVPERSRVTEVITTLNRFVAVGDDEHGAGLLLRDDRGQLLGTIRAAAPNWFSDSTQGWGTGGGAGLPPESIPPGTLPPNTFTFANQDLKEALDADAGQPVVVAILDTSPERVVALSAADRYRQGPINNAFLATVVHSIIFEERPLPSGTLPQYAHLVPYWAQRMGKWQGPGDEPNRDTYYNIVDHGLFVAGVVRSLAPEVPIHLFRVLDSVGIGDLGTLLLTLAELPAYFAERYPKARIVVNLSLLVEEETDDAELCRVGESLLYLPLQLAINWLRSCGVLVVAAAGNDSLDLATGDALSPRQPPRLPARYNQAFSVAAVDEAGLPATFSNLGDSDATPNSIAVFGGNAALDSVTSAPELKDVDGSGPQPPIGIIGVYSGAELPCDKGTNETGLVYWAGTSFAAPIISGIAAQRWSRAGAPATPAALLAEISAFAAPALTPLGCRVIEAKQ